MIKKGMTKNVNRIDKCSEIFPMHGKHKKIKHWCRSLSITRDTLEQYQRVQQLKDCKYNNQGGHASSNNKILNCLQLYLSFSLVFDDVVVYGKDIISPIRYTFIGLTWKLLQNHTFSSFQEISYLPFDWNDSLRVIFSILLLWDRSLYAQYYRH